MSPPVARKPADAPVSLGAAPPMILRKPEDDPRVAGWLVVGENCTQEGYDLVLRGACDDAIWEDPWGSNTGPENSRLRRYIKRAGYGDQPESWCGCWLGAVYSDRGMYVPEYYGGVDQWLPYSMPITQQELKARVKSGSELVKRLPGAAIIYGKRGTIPLQMPDGRGYSVEALKRSGWDGIHIGMITRAELNAGAPDGVAILTREGNRGYGITGNVGVAVDEAPTERHDVIAIHIPRRAEGYVPMKQTIRPVPE